MLFYVDTRKNLKEIRGNGYRFVPKGGMFPTETIRLVVKALVCEKHIPKPAPNGTKNLPQHVDAAPLQHAKFHGFQTNFGFTRI